MEDSVCSEWALSSVTLQENMLRELTSCGLLAKTVCSPSKSENDLPLSHLQKHFDSQFTYYQFLLQSMLSFLKEKVL